LKAKCDGAHYHVTSGTCRGLALFEAHAVRDEIYELINAFSSVYYVTLHAICVLENRYHIVLTMGLPEIDEQDLRQRFDRYEALRAGRPRSWDPETMNRWHTRLADLSMFMKDLNQWIARRINLTLGQGGTVFGERFRSCLIESGPALLASMVYVECQPLSNKITRRLNCYRYSSLGRSSLSGTREAGITIPRECFTRRYRPKRRRQLFAERVHQVAEENRRDLGPPPREPEKAIVWLTWERTGWLMNSIVVGSKVFCEEVMKGYHPGSNRRFHPICGWLYSNHVRAGPYLR